jgi:hypothetical protein
VRTATALLQVSSVGSRPLALVLGLLPIPQLRTLILAAQRTLAATVGDSLAFVESPVRAALIRTRVLNGIERLNQRCERTIIIAHSQGAAVVLDALGGIPELAHEDGQPAPRDAPVPGVVPDTLVTFGAGTKQLASLKVLSKGVPSRIESNPTFQAIGALVIAAFLSVWLYADMIALHTNPGQILRSMGLLLLTFAVVWLYFWWFHRLVPLLNKRWPAVQKYENIAISILIALPMAAIWHLFYLFEEDLPSERVSLLFFVSVIVALSISRILSKDMETTVTTVRKPRGLRRWVDLYASADPVPNGPTRCGKTDVPDQSIPISNLGSILADHTAYWDNLDGFVLRIVTECAETAESPWLAELPTVTDSADKRSAWRVGWLRLARWVVILTWLSAGASLWISHGKDVPLPLDLPGWLPPLAESAARFALLTALIVLVCWASVGTLRLLWRFWARTEQEAVLAHRKPAGDETAEHWLSGMCAVVYLIVVLASQVTEPTLFEGADAGTLIADLILGLFVICSLAWFSAKLLLWFKPAPEDANTEAASVDG